MRYALVFDIGIGPGVPPDGTERTVTSVREARAEFRSLVRELSAPSTANVWLYPASDWDGISYGRDGGAYVLTIGPRGGIVTNRP